MSDTRMPPNYRMMIYFAHSTMVMYQKTITINKEMSVDDFRKANPELMQRVFDEGLNVFNYELSDMQMQKAVYVFMKSIYNPLDVYTTKVFSIRDN